MYNRWKRPFSLLLSVLTALSLAAPGFALEPAELPQDGQTALTQEPSSPPEDTQEAAAQPEQPAVSQEEAPAEPEADPEPTDSLPPAEDDAADPEAPSSPPEAPQADPEEPVASPEEPVTSQEEPSSAPEEAPPVDPEPAPEPQEEAQEAAQPGPQTPLEEEAEGALEAQPLEAAPDTPQEKDTAPALPQKAPPSASSQAYDTLTVAGTRDYDTAAQVLREINNILRQEGYSILSMDEKAQTCAMTRASELTVLYSNSVRPTGESWSTVLGDAGSRATVYLETTACGDVTAQKIASVWTSNETVYRYLSSDSIRSVGIGCFYQQDGTPYWTMIITNQYTDQASGTSAVTDGFPVAYAPDRLGTPKLTLSATTLQVGSTAQITSFVLPNGQGSFLPSQEQIVYSSSSDAVSVDRQGKLTANAPGTAVITASLKGTDCAASVTVTAQLKLTTTQLNTIANHPGLVQITWKAVTGATSYQVYRKLPGGKWSRLGSPVTQTYYRDTTAVSGTTYCYTVRAQYDGADSVIQGGYDPQGLTIRYLATPDLLSAVPSSTGVTVKWQSVSGAASYDVYRKTVQTNWVKLANITGTSYVDTNVTAKTQYFYTVRARTGEDRSYYVTAGISATPSATVSSTSYVVRAAVNYRTGPSTSSAVAGRLSPGTTVTILSGWSTQANGATWYRASINHKIYYIQASYLLAAPSITSVVNARDGLKINWTRVSNATGYCFYWKDSANKWVRIATITSGSQTSWLVPDKDLTSGKAYTFTVLATYGSVRSTFSTTGSTLVYLQTPALLSAVSNDKDQITLTWSRSEGADGYYVFRKAAGAASWSRIATIQSEATVTYADKKAAGMTPYVYTVRAFAGKNTSSFHPNGIGGMIAPAGNFTTGVVAADTKYRTGPSTGSSSPGTLKAGATVQIVSGWSKTANGIVWNQIKLNNALYYIPASSLLATPKLKPVTATGNYLTVSWNKVANATGYRLYRKSGGSGWVRIGDLSASTLSLRDTSVSSGTTYTYTVRARCGSVFSDYDRSGVSLRYLSVPQLTGASAASTGITVKWLRVTGAQGYHIYRKVSGGAWHWIGRVTSGTTLQYRDTQDLMKNTTYVYTVRAYYGSTLSYFQTSGVSAKSTVTLNPDTRAYVTTGDLNYRTSPSSANDSNLAGTLAKGTRVQVVTSTIPASKDGWCMIYRNKNCYYVSFRWLKEA